MALSKVGLLCLESSSYFKQDILISREGVQEVNKKRYRCGEFRDLYEEYRKHCDKFYEYTGVSVDTFDYLLQHIEEHLQNYIKSQRVVTNPEKLFLTLRYLAHGTSFKSLSSSYRLGRSTVAKTIYQTLKALWKAFSKLYIPKPTEDNFRNISEGFYSKWQFPNCIGSIESKHFRIMKPPNRGGKKQNYKKYSVLVLQAITDADYKFIAIEVGGEGLKSDGTFQSSVLNKSLSNNRFNVPPPQRAAGSDTTLPHVLLGDGTYPLKTYLMRPYPLANLDRDKKIFNKRLSRARTTIECAFGVLSNKWRLFIKPIGTNTKHAKLIIEVACVLHNIVRQKEGDSDKDFKEYMDDLLNSKKKVKGSKRNNRATTQAIAIRDKYKSYFVNNPIDDNVIVFDNKEHVFYWDFYL